MGWRNDDLFTESDHTERVSATRDSLFNLSLAQKMSETDDVVSMVANLKFINSILIGMTEFLGNRLKDLEAVG